MVVYKGKVVEDGTYEELSLKPGGHFSRLEAGIAWDYLSFIKHIYEKL